MTPEKPRHRAREDLPSREKEKFLVLPPFPCGMKRDITLLELRIKDRIVQLPYIERFPSRKTRRLLTTVAITAKEGICVSNACFLGGCLTKRSKRARSCSQKEGPPTSMKLNYRGIKTEEKVMWWWPAIQQQMTSCWHQERTKHRRDDSTGKKFI